MTYKNDTTFSYIAQWKYHKTKNKLTKGVGELIGGDVGALEGSPTGSLEKGKLGPDFVGEVG